MPNGKLAVDNVTNNSVRRSDFAENRKPLPKIDNSPNVEQFNSEDGIILITERLDQELSVLDNALQTLTEKIEPFIDTQTKNANERTFDPNPGSIERNKLNDMVGHVIFLSNRINGMINHLDR